MSVLAYLGVMLLMMIPIVGFVMVIIWAFSGNVNKNLKNWSIAMLILMIVGLVIGILFGGAVALIISSMMDAMV